MRDYKVSTSHVNEYVSSENELERSTHHSALSPGANKEGAGGARGDYGTGCDITIDNIPDKIRELVLQPSGSGIQCERSSKNITETQTGEAQNPGSSKRGQFHVLASYIVFIR